MEILLDKTACSRFEAARLAIGYIRDAVYQMTSLQGYRRIARDGLIRPNDGTYDSSFDNSEVCNCRGLNAISLWDFELPSDSIVYDDLSLEKCETVLLIHRPGVFLGFRRDVLKADLLYYEEIKSRCGYGGIIPHVEVCHVGEIRLNSAARIVVVDHYDGRLLIKRKSGYLLTDGELTRLASGQTDLK